MLRILLGKDWIINRQKVLALAAEDVHSRKSGRIIIVPELISHEMERALCEAAGDTASRYAEVISFSRLARRAAENAGAGAQECLDNGGRIVAMAATARQLSSRLKAYAALETKPEFLAELIDAVDEFKRCCISSEDLSAAAKATQGSLSEKLEELALIMEGYDTLCSLGKRDPRDQMTWLLEQLEAGNYAEEHVFYIDGFPDFTRQNLAVIEHLIKTSPFVTVSLNCDQADSHLLAHEKAGSTAGELLRIAKRAGIPVEVEVLPERGGDLQVVRDRLFQGAFSEGAAKNVLCTAQLDTPWSEVMSAAHKAAELVRNGARYRDITLVCTDMSTYQPIVDFVFHRMGIPVYLAGTEEILQMNIIHTVMTALDAAISDFDQRSVIRYLRSALSGMSQNTCDRIENYAFIWGIRGQRWMNTWDKHPDGLSAEWDEQSRSYLEKLNAAREKAIAPLEKLRAGFRKAICLRDQIDALYGFLEDIDLEKQLQTMSDEMDQNGDNRSAQILDQLWEILMSALEQMYDVLGDTAWEADHFSRLLRLLLSQYDVGTIPPVLDAVQVGPVTAMRCHHQKHLIVVGAQEGNLPSYTGSTGVLTDQERVALRTLGVPLTGGAMEGIQEEFAEIYGVFCGAEESIMVTCSGEQPSFVFRRLSELAGGKTEQNLRMEYALANAYETAAWLAGRKLENTAEKLGLQESYNEILRRSEFLLGSVKEENIRTLYGNVLKLSASQVDKQADCRMSYFLNYGLRAKERKEATVDPAEFGTYVHWVLEHAAKRIKEMGGFHNVSLEETLSISHEFSEQYAQEHFSQLDSERMTYLFNRNLRELDMVVQELWEELQESLFEPHSFELGFGDKELLPAITIPNRKINAQLRGYVDRVDVWQSPGSLYYRVVDYKTGKKDFDYCDVFNGVGLQMLLYLFALREGGETVFGKKGYPVGVQYFPARAPYLPSDGVLEDDEAAKERAKEWKRQGLLLNDEEILQAMEPGDKPKRLAYSIKKNGEISGDLADREQMKLLEGYIFRVLGNLVEDIASGNVQPNPYTRGYSHDACRFCPYGEICHNGIAGDRRNYKTMSAQNFWEDVDKEMKSDGR